MLEYNCIIFHLDIVSPYICFINLSGFGVSSGERYIRSKLVISFVNFYIIEFYCRVHGTYKDTVEIDIAAAAKEKDIVVRSC